MASTDDLGAYQKGYEDAYTSSRPLRAVAFLATATLVFSIALAAGGALATPSFTHIAAGSLDTCAFTGGVESTAGARTCTAGSATGPEPVINRKSVSAAAGQCSKAEAIAAVRRLGLSDVSVTYPVWNVLCGAFAGAGSNTMVASISGLENVGMLYWAVFQWSGSEWQLLMKQRRAAILTAAGPDLRETVSVYRIGDPRCCPSGGTKARIWHWNGSSFIASAWTQSAPARGDEKPFPQTYFQTPSFNIVCKASSGFDALAGGGQAFYAGIECVVKTGLKPQPPHTCEVAGGFTIHAVGLGRTGRADVGGCLDNKSAARLLTKTTADVLGYGQTWSGGGLRCTSALTGLTCRNTSSHGFFLSRDLWRAF